MGTTFNHHLQLPLDIDMYAQTRPMINYTEFGKLFHKTVLLHLLPQQLHDFLNRLGISINLCEIFWTPPHKHQFIHRDTGNYAVETVGGEHFLKERKEELLTYQAKMNWCYDHNGDVFDTPSMNWWSTDEQTSEYKYKPEQCTLLESAIIYQPSLIRIDVPHNAFNDTELGRWCISLALGKVNGGPLEWNEAELVFSEWIK